tara:strand:- start:103 stop:480 length:378 start_codon:yes stop_codon:yes gene_type:complete
MKKLICIFVLGLLLSSNSYAGWFDKDKIKVTKCYDPRYAKNYKEYKKLSGVAKKFEWELKLKEKIAIRIIESNGQLKIDKFKIKIVTDDYIIVSDPTGDVQFDLKNETYSTSIIGIQVQQICKFN